MKFGVVVFPGSNCDHDAFYAVRMSCKSQSSSSGTSREDLAGCDAVILPGGFSYGDYLRTGAIARFSPVMNSVEKFAKSGGLVLRHLQRLPDFAAKRGCCPGAVMRNTGLRFICRHVHIRVEADGHAVHVRRERKAKFCEFRSPTTTETTTATTRRSPSSRRIGKIVFRYTNAGRDQ